MKKIAWIFPGQGAQYPGMGKDFADSFSIARETFEEADDLLGELLSQIIFEGPESLLTETKSSQLAIFTMSAALLRTLQTQVAHLDPSYCGGLSLGEYTALFASKRLSFKDTLFLIRERARLMNEACERTEGTMAAVLGLKGIEVEEALRGIEGVWMANDNCPGQIVISGTKEGVEKAAPVLKEKGAKRVLPLSVHGAFHSGLMRSAQEGLLPFLAKAPLQESPVGLVMNVPGAFVFDKEAIRKNLELQVTHPVRWQQGILSMEERGVDLYLEIGPGRALAGMNKKIGVQGSTFSLEKLADLEKIATLGQVCSC